jgi:hypothetical protein
MHSVPLTQENEVSKNTPGGRLMGSQEMPPSVERNTASGRPPVEVVEEIR